MQLTSFDRWLRERFAYETQVQTLRLPDHVPPGVKIIELPEAPGKRYKYMFLVRRPKAADKLFQILKENGQMYETQIIDRKGLFVSIFCPKDKSFSWRIISSVVIATIVFFALMYVKSLLEDPETMKNLREALDILKG